MLFAPPALYDAAQETARDAPDPMALSARLELRVGQSLVMTPQLMQAIKLLQLSNLDLVAYVEQELEKKSAAGARRCSRAGRRGRDGGGAARRRPGRRPGGDWLGDDMGNSRTDIEERLGTDLEERLSRRQGPETRHADAASDPMTSSWSNVGSGGSDSEDYNLEAFVSADLSLTDHLSNQLTLAVETQADRLIGQMLIDAVDDAGYLTVTVEDVADRLGAEIEDVTSVLEVIQASSPRALRPAISLSACRSS